MTERFLIEERLRQLHAGEVATLPLREVVADLKRKGGDDMKSKNEFIRAAAVTYYGQEWCTSYKIAIDTAEEIFAELEARGYTSDLDVSPPKEVARTLTAPLPLHLRLKVGDSVRLDDDNREIPGRVTAVEQGLNPAAYVLWPGCNESARHFIAGLRRIP